MSGRHVLPRRKHGAHPLWFWFYLFLNWCQYAYSMSSRILLSWW